ncbi:MAG: hypothetical protein AAF431_02415 [Pseudomonadota bacterium]
MAENPFASYTIEVPKNYAEDIKKYCQTAGGKITHEYAPFERQVDFWYMSFIYAVANKLQPVPEKETRNITPASILSTNAFRITHIQLAFLAHNESIEELANHRRVFEYAMGMANAGIPYLLQILSDQDDKPLWSLLDYVEKQLHQSAS